MKHFLLATALLIGVNSFAQKEEKEKKKSKKEIEAEKAKENQVFVYKDASFETDDYSVFITDAVAKNAYVKFKMKVFNKTNDFLVVKPLEMGYTSGSKTAISKDKVFVVAPNEEDWKVVDYKGTAMQVDQFVIEAKGIYKASAGGKAIEVSNFDLPPSKNEFSVANTTCILKKHEITTAKTTAKFDCIYSGDGVIIINPYRCAAVMPNGADNANAKKSSPILLEKGQSEDFTVAFEEVSGAGDMQKKGVKIKWNDTFKESKLMKLEAPKITVDKDEEKTKAKLKEK
jgi:hypothetical protein